MWECTTCNEQVEDEFDICWNCQTPKDGSSSEEYFPLSVPKELEDLRERMAMQSDADLKRIINVDFRDYREEAIEFAKAELDKRSLDEPIISPVSPTPKKTEPPRTRKTIQKPSDKRTASAAQPARAASSQVLALMARYQDAYLVAKVTNGFGRLIKGIGIAITILLLLIGFTFIGEGRAGDAAFAMGVVMIVFGVIAGIWFYIIGILVSAQGQILKASLDSAVNSSPFLDNEHRAKIMSLPEA